MFIFVITKRDNNNTLKYRIMKLQNLRFNGKIYGRQGNEYIFVNNERVDVTTEQATEFRIYIKNREDAKFEEGYANREETYADSTRLEDAKTTLEVVYENGVAVKIRKNGGYAIVSDEHRPILENYLKTEIEAGRLFKILVTSNEVEKWVNN